VTVDKTIAKIVRLTFLAHPVYTCEMFGVIIETKTKPWYFPQSSEHEIC